MDMSSLPGDVVDDILASLVIEDQHVIPKMEELTFDCLIHPISNVEIDQALSDHQGPIKKFFLSCRTSPDIDKWIHLLSSSYLEHLTLHIFWGDKHGIASPFFSFQHLKHLNLYRCIFNPPPPEFTGFATLDFQEVDFVPESFEKFISKSPMLEKLRLVDCTKLDEFKIQGPRLSVFKFHGVFKKILFENSPVLAEVSLSLPITVEDSGTRLPTFFSSFHIAPTLKRLHLHLCVLEYLGVSSIPTPSGGSFDNLKVVNLSMHLDSVMEVICALQLARSCPNLEILSVTLYNSGYENDAVGRYIRDYETPKPFCDKLRRVEIAVFAGTMSQIELLRYLLASTVGLKEMVISVCKDDVSLDQIIQLPRASPTADVSVEVWNKSAAFKACTSS